MPNGISHSYQLDMFISVLRVVGGSFHFNSNFDRKCCKQTVKILIRRTRSLVLVCTALYSMSHKRTLSQYGLMRESGPLETYTFVIFLGVGCSGSAHEWVLVEYILFRSF